MLLILEPRGDRIWRRLDGRAAELGDPGSAPHGRALQAWAERCARATITGSEAALRRIGAELYAWLDQGRVLHAWADSPEPTLEVRAESGRRDELTDALLAAPWELLTREGLFLAEDRMRVFAVARRCAGTDEPTPPAYADLSLLFMAAAPEGQSTLDHEAEEAVIIEATRAKSAYAGAGGAPLAHLTVEESGALDLLGERNRLDGPFEALHLSCHGDIQEVEGGPPIPRLLLETQEGREHLVSPEDLVAALEGRVPALLFLSACHTAERGAGRAGGAQAGVGRRDALEGRDPLGPDGPRRDAGGAGAAATPQLAEPSARRLARRVPNVLGWDSSVYDVDAIRFAEALYGALARGETVPRAAALARRALLQARDTSPRLGRHWHLARVYLGPGGGGPLCDPRLPPRPAQPDPEVAFLDPEQERVSVATRAQFVGRRRQIQRILAAYRTGRKGALVLGMGSLGKSSLAARAAARMPKHRLALVHGRYHALAVFEQAVRTALEVADGMELAEARRLTAEVEALRAQVADREEALEDALRRLLRGVYRRQPILLVIDDLEQALEAPAREKALVEPKPALRAALSAVLGAFAAADTPSRLLLTSRYDFGLRDERGVDRAAALLRIPLAPMRGEERTKQWRARARAEGREAEAARAPKGVVDAALAAAAGNPGLQEILTRPLLGGETAEAEAAIAAVARYRATGEHPAEGNATQEFFARVAFATYAAALTPDQARQLSAAGLFLEEVPVPRAALEAAGAALGAEDAAAAVRRLLALGLLDDWGPLGGVPHAAADPLAQPLAARLEAADRPRLARAALPHLVAVWCDANGEFPADPRGAAAAEVALEAGAAPELLEATAFAGAFWRSWGTRDTRWAGRPARDVRSALDLVQRVLYALPPEHVATSRLVRIGAERAISLCETDVLKWLLTLPVRPLRSGDANSAAQQAALDLLRAERLAKDGQAAAAERLARAALETSRAAGDENLTARAAAEVAQRLSDRGELNEALRLLREQALPVFDRLGDLRSRSVALMRVASVLIAAGELQRGHTSEVRKALAEAFRIARALDHPDGIGFSGAQLAQIMALEGREEEALTVLNEAESGFKRLQWFEQVARTGRLRELIGRGGMKPH